MSMKNIIYLLRLRKKLVLTPIFLCPFLAGLFLIFTQPTYVSVAKIWAKEKADESMLLKIQRKGIQENTYAEVQAEIIRSNRVFYQVVDELGLYKPLPSQSIAGKLIRFEPAEELYSDKDYLDAIHMLHKQVSVNVINPEILVLEAKMNTPEVAQKVLRAIIDTYKKVYLEILNKEVDEYEKLLGKRIHNLNRELKSKSDQLIAFEKNNPSVLMSKGLGSFSQGSTVAVVDKISEQVAFSPSLAKTIGDASPIPVIMNKIGELEMEQNQLESVAGLNNYKLRQVQEEIERNKGLLDRYNRDLSNQAQLTIQHDELAWQLDETRKRYDYVVGEYDKILVTRGLKVKQTSSITILDSPSLEHKPIAPKKKITLIASLFLGVVIAFILFYLFVVGDQRIYFPEDLEKITNLPVLSVYTDKR